MGEEYITILGETINADELRLLKSKDLITAIQISPFCNLIECLRLENDEEIIILETEVELGQRKIFDIRRFERLAVVFDASDQLIPDVQALRTDFPKVPHLNLGNEEFPRSLCIYEEPYYEINLRWTGALFLENIREWLAFTAKGKLHGDDQPLEPLIPFAIDYIILPGDLFSDDFSSEFLFIDEPIDSGKNRRTYIAERVTDENFNPNRIKYLATIINCPTQTHGIIAAKPGNLYELNNFLSQAGYDLLDDLRSRLKIWLDDPLKDHILNSKLILIVLLPKNRYGGATPETQEIRTFILDFPIKEIGVHIGIWGLHDGDVGPWMKIDESHNGEMATVKLANTAFSLSREHAKALNGIDLTWTPNIVMVGGGAIGSQIFLNLIRMGVGKWTLIDNDFLLPHNLARHALTGLSLGLPKSKNLAETANQIISGEQIAEWAIDDVLSPSSDTNLEERYKHAEIIIDASTSIAVSRYLGLDINSNARRISCFLNPKGTDLVVLAEDKQRNIPIDCVEMQYYRMLIQNGSLIDHLMEGDDPIRFSNSCRDVTSIIPQDIIALHSSVCSRALLKIFAGNDSSISIWCTDSNNINVEKHTEQVFESVVQNIGEWTLKTDQRFVEKIYEAREKSLPNETGGLLIGAYDMQRKIIYIVDTILSPPDSVEWPTVYIRGIRGVRKELENIEKQTMGNLRYVGEWHSHPEGYGCKPSQSDYTAFQWLAEVMSLDGLPVLMLIAGGEMNYRFFLGEMKKN